MACIHPYWSCIQVGSQHLARQFSNNNWMIDYISAPTTPLHLFSIFSGSPELKRRFASALIAPERHENGSIQAHVPLALTAPAGLPLLRSKFNCENWHRTIIPTRARMIQELSSRHYNLLYIDNIAFGFLLDTLSYDKSVFRVMDIHDQFPGWGHRARSLAADIAQRCDLTVYSARGSKGYTASLRPRKMAFVPNGVEYSLFADASQGSNSHADQTDNGESKLESAKGPIALYTGMLDSRIDWSLVGFLARKIPQVSFFFVGPTAKAQVKNLPSNVHCIGPIAHSKLPYIMKKASIALIPFNYSNNSKLLAGMRPIKLLEFFAAGLPVVSTNWPELENMQSPAILCKSYDEFLQAVRKAISIPPDREELRAYAAKHDWKYSFATLISELNAIKLG